MDESHSEFEELEENSSFRKENKKEYPPEYDPIRFTVPVYRHPFFTYHIAPPDIWDEDPRYSQRFPYSVELRTYLDETYFPPTNFYAEDITEGHVVYGFFRQITHKTVEHTVAFLNFQYNAYASRANHDPTHFLWYLMYVVEICGDRDQPPGQRSWDVNDINNLQAIDQWIRSHEGYREEFDERLRDWPTWIPAWLERKAVDERHARHEYNKALNAEKQKTASIVPSAPPLPKYNPTAIEEKKAGAKAYLEHLSGHNRTGKKIMSDDDHKRMVEYTHRLIQEGAVPTSMKPIMEIFIPRLHLQYTFYLIHTLVNGPRSNKDLFVDFLYALFPNLYSNITRDTAITQFSKRPNSYEADVKEMER